MNLKPKKIRNRLFALLAAVVLLLSFVGCSSGSSQSTLTANTVKDEDMEEGCQLTRDELDSIAKILAATYSSTLLTRDMLVAAYRGYDMTAADFDDTKVEVGVAGEPNVEYALKVIEKANAAADDSEKIGFSYDALTAADMLTLIKALQTTVVTDTESGILDTVLGWIGTALKWMTNTLCFGSYIGGICIFAILIELLMLPLSIKQHKSSLRQASLAPKEQAIRKKYAGRDDQVTRQKMTQELQEMYQTEGYSPASGCLPLLVQLPIILALYNIVIDPLRYVLGQSSALSTALSTYSSTARAAGGLGLTTSTSRGTITLLSQLKNDPSLLDGIKNFLFFDNGSSVYDKIKAIEAEIPNFNLGSVNLGEVPSLQGTKILLLVPVLTFVIYFFSMRLTKKFTYQPANMTAANDKQAACSSWMMDITMPLMSVYIAFIVPALVGIYWMFKSVISTLRQFIVVKCIPYPKFTDEDYRAAEREYAGKAPKHGEARQYSYGRDTRMVGGKPKSLFHMDDDDYAAKVQEEAEKDAASEAEKGKSGALDAAPLKKDDKR